METMKLIDTINLHQSELEKAIQMDYSRTRMWNSDFQRAEQGDGSCVSFL